MPANWRFGAQTDGKGCLISRLCNFLTQNVSGSILGHSPHLWRRARRTTGIFAPKGRKTVEVNHMSSTGSTAGWNAASERALRVGVVGAGIMGSHQARVLGGLPDVTMVGIVDPLAEHRTGATDLAGCRAFATLDELIAEG